MFDTKTETVSNPNVRNVASIGDFHTLPAETIPSGEDAFILEREISKLETLHSQAIKDFVQTVTSGQAIGAEVRIGVAHAVAFQWLRTAQRRSEISNMLDRGLQSITELLPSRSDTQAQFEENAKIMSGKSDAWHLSLIADMQLVEVLARIIADHAWFLMYNKTRQSFVTTDDPTPLDSTNDRMPPWMGVGISTPGARILYPLSSEWLLWTNNIPETAIAVESITHILDDIAKIKRINAYLVSRCNRWVFSRDNDFGFIKELLQRKTD